MTLPSSGSISMAQIRNEYGLGNPVSMSQLYGKPGIPSSGQLSFSTFHGKSNAPTFDRSPGTYSVNDGRISSLKITASFPVVWTWSRATGNLGIATPSSGSSSTSWTGTINADRTGSRGVTFYVTASFGGVSYNWTVNLIATDGTIS